MNVKYGAHSIRTLIDDLKKNHPDEIVEVDDEVSVSFEPTAYYLHYKKRSPVLLFNNVEGYPSFSLVTNIFGTEKRLAKISGFTSIKDVINNWSDVANGTSNTSLSFSSDGTPFHSKMIGDSLDLFSLPFTSHYEMDGSNTGFGRYITGGLTATADPEDEDVVNLSFSRIQPFARNKFAFDAGSHGHLWRYLDSSRKRNERLKMTILIGPNPVYYLLAASFIDNEFKKVKKIFDATFVRGYSNNIPIPFDTEIAIEAEFVPEESFEEGPFAEYVGYMGYDSTRFVAEVKSILSKENPIFYDIQPSNSSEHVNLFSVPRSSMVMKQLREALPKGPRYEVNWPHYGGRFISFGYVNSIEPGLAKQLGMTILGLDPLWNKIIFVNEGETKLDLETALINLASSGDFSVRNVSIISGMFVISSDPTRDERGNTGKIIITTRGPRPDFKRVTDGESVKLMTAGGGVLISHKKSTDQKISVIVGDDIDLNDYEQVGWALATRMNPETDITIERDRITLEATRKVPPVARIPERVMNKIEKRIRSLDN